MYSGIQLRRNELDTPWLAAASNKEFHMPPCYLSDKEIRILNFDDSVLNQKNLIQKFSNPPYTAEIIDFKEEAPCVRYWANREDLYKIKRKIDPGKKNIITFYGSGDFHHISIRLDSSNVL
jgi:hypothetical protein